MSISPPASVLPPDMSVLPPDMSVPPTHTASGADEILNNIAWDFGNANLDLDWWDTDFPGLERDLDVDWGIAAGLTGV